MANNFLTMVKELTLQTFSTLGGRDMDIQKGDRVLVNLAPFIGSARRHDENIPCEVVDIHVDEIEIRTQSPYREFQLRVARSWIESKTNGQVCLT